MIKYIKLSGSGTDFQLNLKFSPEGESQVDMLSSTQTTSLGDFKKLHFNIVKHLTTTVNIYQYNKNIILNLYKYQN